jgi:hypothetical protein
MHDDLGTSLALTGGKGSELREENSSQRWGRLFKKLKHRGILYLLVYTLGKYLIDRPGQLAICPCIIYLNSTKSFKYV